MCSFCTYLKLFVCHMPQIIPTKCRVAESWFIEDEANFMQTHTHAHSESCQSPVHKTESDSDGSHRFSSLGSHSQLRPSNFTQFRWMTNLFWNMNHAAVMIVLMKCNFWTHEEFPCINIHMCPKLERVCVTTLSTELSCHQTMSKYSFDELDWNGSHVIYLITSWHFHVEQV